MNLKYKLTLFANKLNTNAPKDNKRLCIECVILIVLALVLRLLYIDKPDIGNDECFSLYYAQFSIPDIIKKLCNGDNPPLWEILLHFFIVPFGSNVLFARILSLFFSVLTIIPIYIIGENLIRRNVGLIASVMYAFSSFSLFLAHDGRVYSMIGFFSGMSIFLFLKLIKEKKSSTLIWLTIINIIIIYSHYLAIWIIVSEAILVITIPFVRSKIGKYYLFHLLALVILFIPMLPVLYERFCDSGLHGTWIQKSSGISDMYFFFTCFTNSPVSAVITITILLVSCAIFIYNITKKRNLDTSVVILTGLWAIPTFISFGLSFFVGFFYNRYFYFIIPSFFISIASYIKRWPIPIRNITYTILICAIIVSFKADSTTMKYGGWKGDTKAVSLTMQNLNNKENTATIIAPSWIDKQLIYYFDEDHSIFQKEGSATDEPAFREYMTKNDYYIPENYKYYKIENKKQIILVFEKSYNISEIENFLKDNAYYQTGTEVHKQVNINIYNKQ